MMKIDKPTLAMLATAKSDYQLEVEAWVKEREADRRRLAEVMDVEFEALEDESKGDGAVTTPTRSGAGIKRWN